MILTNSVLQNLTDGLMTITINRPEKLNALNNEVLSEIEKIIDKVIANNAKQVEGEIISSESSSPTDEESSSDPQK